jgi:cytochrome c2
MNRKTLTLFAAILLPFTFVSVSVAEDTPSVNASENQDLNLELLNQGRILFTQICSRCHKTSYDESIVGAPGLQGVLERHNEDWLNQWIKSPEAFAQKNDDARDLINSNRFGLAMPTIPAMQDENHRKAVIEYLKTLK